MEPTELVGKPLDEAVAAVLGWHKHFWSDDGEDWDWRYPPSGDDQIGTLAADENWSPSTDWAHGGPLIEEHKIELIFYGTYGYAGPWEAQLGNDIHYIDQGPGDAVAGATPLIAAMRALVAAKTPNVPRNRQAADANAADDCPR